MKLFKIATVVGLACLFLVACSEQSPITTGQVEKNDSQATSQVAASAPVVPSEIEGTLTQTEKGLAVVTDTETYIVAGHDLSEMVGQKVNVTGAIAQVKDGQVIQVMSVIPID